MNKTKNWIFVNKFAANAVNSETVPLVLSLASMSIESKLLASLPWDILIGEEKEIISPEVLVKHFQESCSHDKELAIGMEYERSGIYTDILKPVSYKGSWGKKGYLDILKRLNTELGWEIVWQENGNIYELRRSGTRITLEADGRLEMCSKPRTNLHDLAHEFKFYNHEITEVSKIFGIAHLGIGLSPFHKSDEISFCPKARYSILKRFYKNSAALSDWLKIVNGIHVNFDYTSEQDAIRKSQLMWRASSILAAMFAFSPIQNNKPASYLDTRLTITNKFDSNRTNLHKEFLRKDFSFKKWLDFCLDQKMFYIMREEKPIYPKKTFREFIDKGTVFYENRPRIFPTIRDFNLHLKSIWLEIRIRKYIEFRAIDSVPPFLVMAGPALVKGLLYGEESMAETEKLIGDLSFEELMQLREDVIKENLRAPLRKKKVLDYAKELLTIASDNLKSFKNLNEKEEDESVYLEPLKEFILIKEKSPARYVLEKWQGEWDKSHAKLIEWCTAETRPA